MKMSRSLSVTVKVSHGTAPAPVQTRMEQLQTTPGGQVRRLLFLPKTEWMKFQKLDSIKKV